MSRLCLCQLQMTSNDLKFLFISWSGPAYSDVERRKQVLRDMLTLIEMFMVGKPVLILIGGEFHLRFDQMVHIVGEYQHLHLCDCSKESYYPNKTSHFIISQQMASWSETYTCSIWIRCWDSNTKFISQILNRFWNMTPSTWMCMRSECIVNILHLHITGEGVRHNWKLFCATWR